MYGLSFVSTWTALLIGVASCGMTTGEPKFQISTRPLKSDYLLGEPVALEVTVTNTSSAIVRQQISFDQPRVFISVDGEVFDEYEMGIWATPEAVMPSFDYLLRKPNEKWSFQLRVLYTYKRPSGLAFEKSGTYFLKVVYPLLWLESEKQSPTRLEFTSNMIQIRIRPPVGVDAQVWERIKGPDFAYFFQSGEVNLNREDCEEAKKTVTPAEYANGSWLIRIKYEKFIPTALSIFESYSNTAYREPLREALLSFYNRSKSSLTVDQANRMRTILRIKEGLFPDDARLNTMLEIAFPEMTPLDVVFAYVSKQTGVPLYLDDQFNKGRLKSFPRDKLRRFMTWMSAYKAQWIPVGKGYRLIPKAEEPR